MLIRYRAEDFRPIRHLGGTSPGWPVTYDEMEPWYQRAEELYRVRGDAGAGPDRAAPLRPLPLSPGSRRAEHRRRFAGA